MNARRPWLAGGALGLVLALPWTREAMESSMWRHMLLQFPAWLLAGDGPGAGLSPGARAGAARRG
ncbi:MAG TPA: hypothetical protein PKD71_07870 [Ottowia sp.]|nr:hypothetical protein [Ottowia sp.]